MTRCERHGLRRRRYPSGRPYCPACRCEVSRAWRAKEPKGGAVARILKRIARMEALVRPAGAEASQ